MTANIGTLVPAKIVPNDSADIYATHSEVYGQGGYRTIALASLLTDTTAAGIPTARRIEGMLVYAIDTKLVYQLGADLTTWTLFAVAGGGGSGSPSDEVLAELRYISRQYANIIMTNAEFASAQTRRGNYFADGFEVTTYIRTSGLVSSNYTQKQLDSDSDGLNDYVIQPSKTSAISAITNNTALGNMTSGGGLAKAFDGVASGAGSTGSPNTAVYAITSGAQLQYAWIGQDFGAVKSFNKVVITPDTTGGFEMTGAVGSITFNWFGSNTAPDINGNTQNQFDRVQLTTAPVTITADKTAAVTLTAKTGLGSYRYSWVTITAGNGLTRTFAVSEVVFWQNAGAINNMTLYGGMTASTPIKVPAAPAYWRMWVDIASTDVNFSLASDFTAYASRNGGTNFQQLPLTDLIGDTNGPVKLYRSAWVDCSAGHSAGSPPTLATKFVSANNHDFNFRRYLFEWRYS